MITPVIVPPNKKGTWRFIAVTTLWSKICYKY